MKLEKKINGFDCSICEQIAIVFNTRPEFIEDVINLYDLKQTSKIYLKMCELGYKLNRVNFICLYHIQ